METFDKHGWSLGTKEGHNVGYIWTAYGIDYRTGIHEPLKGYRQIFAFTRAQATQRFKYEYGKDSSILYLVGDIFSQWEDEILYSLLD